MPEFCFFRSSNFRPDKPAVILDLKVLHQIKAMVMPGGISVQSL